MHPRIQIFVGEFESKDPKKQVPFPPLLYSSFFTSTFLTNLKSGLCPRSNNLLCSLASLSLSRMEGIPHQVINLDFAFLY